MNVAIIGYGVEGKSAARYWEDAGNHITICDANPDTTIPSGAAAQTGPDYLKNLDRFDLIVRSPGTRPDALLTANPNLDLATITSPTNEFLENCPAKVIGVTGTKGKGTTSTLIARMLAAGGARVHLGGNIGTPALNLLPQIEPEDWVVLELSSFQLIDARRSPHIAVMLMIAPDHQDWHPDMAEYLIAKQNIFVHQEAGDRAIYNACNLDSLQSGLGAPAEQLPYNAPDGAWCDGQSILMAGRPICKVADVALPGRHNLDNVCAAVAATWPILQDPAPIKQAIRAFAGLEHRLERVAEIGGVTYVNDSYSASPGATLAALQAYAPPKVLILGGTDKHLDLHGLAREVAQSNVRQVVVIGEVAPQLTAALTAAGYTKYVLGTGPMDDIVALAAKQAHSGDVVLLSPGTASFDMFKNFQDRGAQFRAAVRRLQERA